MIECTWLGISIEVLHRAGDNIGDIRSFQAATAHALVEPVLDSLHHGASERLQLFS